METCTSGSGGRVRETTGPQGRNRALARPHHAAMQAIEAVATMRSPARTADWIGTRIMTSIATNRARGDQAATPCAIGSCSACRTLVTMLISSAKARAARRIHCMRRSRARVTAALRR